MPVRPRVTSRNEMVRADWERARGKEAVGAKHPLCVCGLLLFTKPALCASKLGVVRLSYFGFLWFPFLKKRRGERAWFSRGCVAGETKR